jgi:hypothetical protein
VPVQEKPHEAVISIRVMSPGTSCEVGGNSS